ncbi:aspartate/glutamate racemase family protein [Paracoccus siganidrum]|uniref:HyuE hydantoin racemase n=1 Tax=Paracoccus siganidrum TaxID=1276757 RepID=A0A419AAY4_9RHOB|nr:aspartate/glutamate racemase family protein [Paracoccus siganidrum]RJL20424.1 HyuE hydantoin racemase [Paracoccus siganidrum]RMC39214.1 HyuE hydantoin racemase [Paracoccus siganidrum]
MRLFYLNPNSSAHMTESIVAHARAALPDATIIGHTNHGAPPAIQGPDDGEAALPGLLAALPLARREGADAIVIACFDDTGLEALRRLAPCPVLGIGQSACASAALLGLRWSVVTTLQVSVPVIRANIDRAGLGEGCASVRASGIPVLEVERGGPEVLDRLATEFDQAYRQDDAQAIVLGCAGMAGLKADLERRSPLPIFEGIEAAGRMAGALIPLVRRRAGQDMTATALRMVACPLPGPE